MRPPNRDPIALNDWLLKSPCFSLVTIRIPGPTSSNVNLKPSKSKEEPWRYHWHQPNASWCVGCSCILQKWIMYWNYLNISNVIVFFGNHFEWLKKNVNFTAKNVTATNHHGLSLPESCATPKSLGQTRQRLRCYRSMLPNAIRCAKFGFLTLHRFTMGYYILLFFGYFILLWYMFIYFIIL